VSAFPLGTVWGERVLRGVAAGAYRNLFTDEVLVPDPQGELQLSQLFTSFPVALLQKEPR
jgi:maltooligosyltrehalose synthase